MQWSKLAGSTVATRLSGPIPRSASPAATVSISSISVPQVSDRADESSTSAGWSGVRSADSQTRSNAVCIVRLPGAS